MEDVEMELRDTRRQVEGLQTGAVRDK